MFKKGVKVITQKGLIGEVIEVVSQPILPYPVRVLFSNLAMLPGPVTREFTLEGRYELGRDTSWDIALLVEEEKPEKENKPFLVNRYNIDEGIALLEQAMLEVFFQEERELILQEELEENRTLVLKDSVLKSLGPTGVCLRQVEGDEEILQSLEDRRSKYIAYKKRLTPLTLTIQQIQILIKASKAEREEIIRVLTSYSGKEALPASYTIAGIMKWYETYCL